MDGSLSRSDSGPTGVGSAHEDLPSQSGPESGISRSPSQPQEPPVSTGPAYDVKEQVRQATDIVDLVGSHLQLRRQGRGYVALCPWHDDSRPSLQVNPDRQSWKCWVCDIGGDVFSFAMKREGVEFPEALRMLAERAGIELNQGPRKKVEPGSADDKQTLYKAAVWAEQQFHDCYLHANEAAEVREYVQARGINERSIERFRLGFAPNDWHWLSNRAANTQFSAEVLSAIGLLGKSERSGRYYDRFKGRLLFPIRDTQNRPIAFGGRILPSIAEKEQLETGRTPAKYINSPETRLFSKSDQLYGLDLARDAVSKSREIVVVEGYTDVVIADQFGLDNVTAVLGTALNERHIQLIRRFADQVTLVLDGDEAGQRRTNEILELFVAAEVDLRILPLPDGQDPCDFLQQHGTEAFRELLSKAVDALEHKITIETTGIDLVRDTHRANLALENILQTIAKAPQAVVGHGGKSRLREQQVLVRLSRQFAIPENELRERCNTLRRRMQSRSSQRATEPTQETTSYKLDSLTPHDSELLEILLAHPDQSEFAVERIGVDELSSEPARKVFALYHEFYAAGEQADFARIMTEIEEPSLKYLVEQLAERAQAKANHAGQDEAARLQGLIQAYHDRRAADENRAQLNTLQNRDLNEEEELDLLLKLKEQQRMRQGISAPTDG